MADKQKGKQELVEEFSQMRERMEAAEDELKRAREALRESEIRFKAIHAQSPIGIVLRDRDGKVVHSNKAALDMFGLFPDVEVAELPWSNLFDDPFVPKEAKEYLAQGKSMRYEQEMPFDFAECQRLGLYRTEGAAVGWVDVLVHPVLGDEGEVPIGYVQQIQDITERKRTEEVLRDLSRQLVEAQEVERRHIARELHDHIGQALTGLKLLVEMASHSSESASSASLREAQDIIDDLIGRIRNLSLDLRPSMLDDLGLLPTLLWHFDRYTVQTGVEVSFKHRGLNRRFSPETETTIYRIAQEALTNVARHASVGEVAVRITARQQVLTVHIEDQGVGFNLQNVLSDSSSSGLVGMRERVVSVGGWLEVDTVSEHGTHLVVQVPFEQNAQKTK